MQGSKFHSSDCLRWVKMTVGQVEYLQDLSNRRLCISDFHISCIGFMYFRQVNGAFGQVIFTIHLPDGEVHSIWNFEACNLIHLSLSRWVHVWTLKLQQGLTWSMIWNYIHSFLWDVITYKFVYPDEVLALLSKTWDKPTQCSPLFLVTLWLHWRTSAIS